MITAEGMNLVFSEDFVTWRARGSESTIDLIFTILRLIEVVILCKVRLDL